MPADLSSLGLCEDCLEYAENCECGLDDPEPILLLDDEELCEDCHQNDQNCECAVVRGPTYTRVLTYADIVNVKDLEMFEWALKWEAYGRLDGPLAGYDVHHDRENQQYTITFYTERGKPITLVHK